MSGGSWEYVYIQIEDTAERLMESDDPMRRALGRKLLPFAAALHDIEWVDSCDYGPGDDVAAIRAALGDNWKKRALAELVDELRQLLHKWQKIANAE